MVWYHILSLQAFLFLLFWEGQSGGCPPTTCLLPMSFLFRRAKAHIQIVGVRRDGEGHREEHSMRLFVCLGPLRRKPRERTRACPHRDVQDTCAAAGTYARRKGGRQASFGRRTSGGGGGGGAGLGRG